MRWATRRCHIDRAACAWLIHRFLDPEAEFVFVDDLDEVPDDATPFDMRGVDLSHHGGECSFETILRRYELADPVLWEIAKVVHEADGNAPSANGAAAAGRCFCADFAEGEEPNPRSRRGSVLARETRLRWARSANCLRSVSRREGVQPQDVCVGPFPGPHTSCVELVVGAPRRRRSRPRSSCPTRCP